MPAADEYLPRLRRRLLLDWDDPLFTGPLFVGEGGAARKKLQELTTSKSESAVVWNVFRTFQKLPAQTWLPAILAAARCDFDGPATPLTVDYWQTIPPPRSRLLWLLDHLNTLGTTDAAQARIDRVLEHLDRWKASITEGVTRGDGVFESSIELDAVLTTPTAVIVVSVRSTSDIATATQWDAQRDDIARHLDAALDLAGDNHQPYFLFVTDDYKHPITFGVLPMAYESLMPRYRSDRAFRATRLAHRTPEELARLEDCVGWLSLADLVDAVLDRSAGFTPDQKRLLMTLVDYLRSRRLLHKGG